MSEGKTGKPTKFTTAGILTDPAASYWLKDAIKASLQRDPVDALNDALILVDVLRDHLDEIQGGR